MMPQAPRRFRSRPRPTPWVVAVAVAVVVAAIGLAVIADRLDDGGLGAGRSVTVVEGALLAPVDGVEERDDPCRSPGAVRCVRGGPDGDGLVAVVSEAPSGEQVAVHRRAGGRHTMVLATVDEAGRPVEGLSEVAVTASDLTGDGSPELVVTARLAGSGGVLSVDIVESGGDVTLHLDLDKGRLEIDGRRLVTYSAQFGADDPNCCPSQWRVVAVEHDGEQWAVAGERVVDPEEVPGLTDG